MPLLIVGALICIGKVSTAIKKASQQGSRHRPTPTHAQTRQQRPQRQSRPQQAPGADVIVDVNHHQPTRQRRTPAEPVSLPRTAAAVQAATRPAPAPQMTAPRRVEGERVTTDPPSHPAQRPAAQHSEQRQAAQQSWQPDAAQQNPLAGFNLRQAVIWSEVLRPRYKDL
ncbi:MAG: hypothetical protein K2M55_05895 [Muribaculaceae bacterium]|nr:hypothetical protein [Muribaculaceae bacterium]